MPIIILIVKLCGNQVEYKKSNSDYTATEKWIYQIRIQMVDQKLRSWCDYMIWLDRMDKYPQCLEFFTTTTGDLITAAPPICQE